MQKPFSREVRRRFEKLMKLAAESPYPGEQANARAAASRLAADHGMSIDEVARAEVEPEPPPSGDLDVDASAGQWREPSGSEWQYYDTGVRPEVEELCQYARACRAEQKELFSSEIRLLLFCWIVVIAVGLINSASRNGLFEFLQFVPAAS